jgi:hypothetical protein
MHLLEGKRTHDDYFTLKEGVVRVFTLNHYFGDDDTGAKE